MLKELMKGKKTTCGSFTLGCENETRTLHREGGKWMSRKQIGYQPICQYHDSIRSRCDGLFILLRDRD